MVEDLFLFHFVGNLFRDLCYFDTFVSQAHGHLEC